MTTTTAWNKNPQKVARMAWDSQHQSQIQGVRDGINSTLHNDNMSLLLAQERRLAKLEEVNKKLDSERKILQHQCLRQQKKIQALESKRVSRKFVRQEQTIPVDDMPMLDASEFLPVKDTLKKESTVQRLLRVSGNLVKTAVPTKPFKKDSQDFAKQ